MTTQVEARPAQSLAPVVDDMSIYVVGGRQPNTSGVLQEAEDAERLGFRRVWLSERLTTKESGVILSAAGARTTRLGLGTGAISATSRLPVVIASMGASLHSVHGPRFTLGIGRGLDTAYVGHGFTMPSYSALIDCADMVRRLWRGETIDYDGPLGSFHGLRMVDLPEGPPPEIYFVHLGGPKASKVAAHPVFDGAVLTDFLSVDACHNSVQATEAECERIGRDRDSLRIVQCVVTAPELDEHETRRLVHARIVGILDYVQMADHLLTLNGWEESVKNEVLAHPKLQGNELNADQSFLLTDVMDVSTLIPDTWIQESAAVGTVAECVRSVQRWRDAGADEIAVYASTPAQNADLIGAWRERPEAR